MPTTALRAFGPFRLDAANEQLWRGERAITLRRKTFAVLHYLVEHYGQLVTKEALLDSVWGDVAVSDTMPAICVAELRRILQDDPKTPQFIETAHRRGYRFIAPVTTAITATIAGAGPAPVMVGRGSELTLMRGWYEQALAGARQIIFIAGEVGIGKTAFAHAFVSPLIDEGVRVGWGQCIEQYGAGEPYMPVLEALTRLAKAPGGDRVVATLKKFAPNWLLQMPSLLSNSDREHQKAAAPGLTHQRMLREMAEALEALAAETPLVLVLEDLHWSDFSTIELISVMARRTERARLLMVGTYRPVQMLASEHPLRTLNAELELHRQCRELRLRLLSDTDVADYLEQRFGGDHRAESLKSTALMIHGHTEGNPLFVVNVVDYLIEQGTLLGAGPIETPPTIQRLIEHNLERLTTEEQQVLEGASVIGAEFAVASVAAALERPISDIETCCARLARREQFIDANGAATWPDATVAAKFRFHHALYEEVFYSRLPAGGRGELHRRVAERLENAFGERSSEVASELAHHYRCANQQLKAIKFFQLAGDQAVRRAANREAIAHFQAALQIVEALPHHAERFGQELSLCMKLRDPLTVVNGYTSSEVEEICSRARRMCQNVGASPELFGALGGLQSVYLNRRQSTIAIELAQQMLSIADRLNRRDFRLWSHYAMGFALTGRGDYVQAREHLEQAAALYDRQRAGGYGFVQDPGPTCLIRLAFVIDELGYRDLASKRAFEGLRLAREVPHPFTLAWCLNYYGFCLLRQGNMAEASSLFDEGVELCKKHGFDALLGNAMVNQGRLRARLGTVEEGITRIREGIAMNSIVVSNDSHGVLAEALEMAGYTQEGIALVDEALARDPDWKMYLPWLNRVKGDLLVKQNAPDRAEACFLLSIDVARTQANKLQELIATSHLARLFKSQGRLDEGRVMLASIYNWFTEGFDTADLKEAKALLDELSADRAALAPTRGRKLQDLKSRQPQRIGPTSK